MPHRIWEKAEGYNLRLLVRVKVVLEIICCHIFWKVNIYNANKVRKQCRCYSSSEALIFASINPKYDNKLFVEFHFQYKKTTISTHNSTNNQVSNFGVIDERMSASDIV